MPKLLGVLIGVTLAALVLSLMGQITGQSLLIKSVTLGRRPSEHEIGLPA